MLDTEYAYGVARIRANELSLFAAADLEQLITSTDYQDALRILGDKGWKIPEPSMDFGAMLENEILSAWQLLSDAAPDIKELDSLIITNDFHNLKAALKTMTTEQAASDYFLFPSVVPTVIIEEAISAKQYMLLPAYLRETAERAYDAIVRLGSGRLADILLDKDALDTRIRFAKQSGCSLLIELAEFAGAAANIKTAVRCAKTGKDAAFIIEAMCDCSILDSEKLIETALSGDTELTNFLAAAFSEQASEKLKAGMAAFEKWTDETMAKMVQKAKYAAFSLEPLAAFYINKELDVKNARIILSAKQNNLTPELIRTRVRVTDV